MDAEWLVGRWHNLGYAVRGDVLTVAVLAPGNNGPSGPPRISLRLCPLKLRDLRRAPARPPALPPASVDPLVEAVCGLKVPPGQYHVFLFQENHALPDL
jgi:hypothetical protein